MREVVIYTSAWCGYCSAAKRILDRKGAPYREIPIDQTPGAREQMMERSGRRTVPQIFVGDHHVGGHDDLQALDRAGGLDSLLNAEGGDNE